MAYLIKKSLVVIFGVVFVLVLTSVPGRADECKSECEDDYTSGKASCMLDSSGPNHAYDLRVCLSNEKKEYEQCLDECDSD
jgi:hypothetical protein